MTETLSRLGVVIDPTDSQQGVGAINRALDSLRAEAQRTLNRIDDLSQKTGKSFHTIKSAIFNVQNAFAALGVGYAFKTIIDRNAELESSITDLSKITSESQSKMRADVLALDSALGSAAELSAGYYQAISAGAPAGAQALDLLTSASQAAKAAHLDQGIAILAGTKLMAGYRGEITKASQAFDLMFAIEEQGQTSFREMAPYIGTLASTASVAGVNAREMAAAFAQVTQTAGTTEMASTSLRALFVALASDAAKLSQVTQSLGYSTTSQMVAAKGLFPALQQITEKSKQLGLNYYDLIGSAEAVNALLAVESDHFDLVGKKLDVMNNASGRTAQAWADFSKTFDASWATMLNTLDKGILKLGDEGAFEGFKNAIDSVTRGIDRIGEGEGLEMVAKSLGTIVETGTGVTQVLLGIEDPLSKHAVLYENLAGAIEGTTVALGVLTGAYTALKGISLLGLFNPWIGVPVALGVAAYTFADDLERAIDPIARQRYELEKLVEAELAAAKQADPLISEYQRLVSITDRNASQSEKLESVVKRLTELYPELASVLDRTAESGSKLVQTFSEIELAGQVEQAAKALDIAYDKLHEMPQHVFKVLNGNPHYYDNSSAIERAKKNVDQLSEAYRKAREELEFFQRTGMSNTQWTELNRQVTLSGMLIGAGMEGGGSWQNTVSEDVETGGKTGGFTKADKETEQLLALYTDYINKRREIGLEGVRLLEEQRDQELAALETKYPEAIRQEETYQQARQSIVEYYDAKIAQESTDSQKKIDSELLQLQTDYENRRQLIGLEGVNALLAQRDQELEALEAKYPEAIRQEETYQQTRHDLIVYYDGLIEEENQKHVQEMLNVASRYQSQYLPTYQFNLSQNEIESLTDRNMMGSVVASRAMVSSFQTLVRQESALVQVSGQWKNSLDEARGILDRMKQEGTIDEDQYKVLLNQTEEAITEANHQFLMATEEWSAGMKVAFEDYVQTAKDSAQQAYDFFTNAMSGMEDAFVKFAQTGQLSFDSLVNSIVADFARITYQKTLGTSIANLFSGMSGLFGGAFATGGEMVPGKYYLVGEEGPELVRSESNATVFPNDVTREIIREITQEKQYPQKTLDAKSIMAPAFMNLAENPMAQTLEIPQSVTREIFSQEKQYPQEELERILSPQSAQIPSTLDFTDLSPEEIGKMSMTFHEQMLDTLQKMNPIQNLAPNINLNVAPNIQVVAPESSGREVNLYIDYHGGDGTSKQKSLKKNVSRRQFIADLAKSLQDL